MKSWLTSRHPRDRRLRTSDVISLVLNPSLLTGCLLCILAVKYGPSGTMQLVYASLCTLFVTVVPVSIVVVLRAQGNLRDLDMSDRPERERVYLLCTGGYALGGAILFALGSPWPLWGFVAIHVPNTLLLLFVNRRLKVSIHAMVLTGVYVGALMFFGNQVLLLGMLVIVAGWARWDAGNHTGGELICGALMGALLVLTEIYFLRHAFEG